MKITEGEVLQEKHDYKGDAIGMAVGGGGGSLLGLIFSNVGRGVGLGFAAGAVYVVARKGKEIDLPANSGMLTRMDSTINVPFIGGEQLAGRCGNSQPAVSETNILPSAARCCHSRTVRRLERASTVPAFQSKRAP